MHYTYGHPPYHATIVDCILVEPATASLKGLVTDAQENSTNQMADVLAEVQLHLSFELDNGYPGKRSPQTKDQNQVLVIRSTYNNLARSVFRSILIIKQHVI